jgi:LacI family transcriptional regulator
MEQRHKRVLLLLDFYQHQLIAGIERYAQDHGWSLSRDIIQQRRIPWGWKGNGILTWLAQTDEMVEFIAGAGKPTVDFNFQRKDIELPRVILDNARMSQLVADHFLARGMTNFVFYSDEEIWSFDEKALAFIEAVRLAGYNCTWLCWARSSFNHPSTPMEQWELKRWWLTTELKNLPKPLAVFSALDWLAAEDVLGCCEDAGLMVPDEVAIAGSGNYLLAVDTMPIPITTIDPNWEGMGYRGAALLDSLMDGNPPPREPIRWPPAGLIVRKSTDLFAVNHEGIAKSLHFMWDHFREPIKVDDLARIAGMSVRGYHKAVQRHIGRSPGHELHRIRLEHARLLLTLSDEKAESVAGSCGFASYNSFWASFRKTTGMSPQQYRREYSGGFPHLVK